MQDVKFCPKCGTPLQPEFMFCTSCGFALSTVRDAAPENTTPQNTTPVEEKPLVVETPPPVTSQPVTPQATIPVTPTPVPATPVAATPLAASPQVPAPKPAAINTGASFMPPRVHALVIALILAGIGVWIWTNERPANNNTGTNSYFPGKDNGNTGKDNNPPIVTYPINNIQAADFAGVWRAYEASGYQANEVKIGNTDDDLIIELNNGGFIMYSRGESHEEDRPDVNCTEVVGNTISCTLKNKEDSSSFSLKMEMEDSKNEMTITVVQQGAPEPLVLKARRV